MKISSSKVLSAIVAAIMFGALFSLAACGQLGSICDSSGSSSTVCQVSSANSVTDYQKDADASANEHQVFKSLISTARKTRMSFIDVLGDAVDKAKDKAGEVADAVNDAKDEAGRRLSEWQKQHEEAAREREEAKARAMEVLESAKLTKKKKTLEYSDKKARPLKLVECSDPRVKVTAEEKVDRSKPGTTKVVYTLSYDGQSVKREVKFKVRDTKVPQIDFADVAPKVNVGDYFVPKNNVNFVKDPVDGLLEYKDSVPETKGKKPGAEVFYDEGWYTVKGSVDTSTEGVYTIEVDASDANGNTKHRTFDVTVVAPAPEPEAPEATMMMRSMSEDRIVYVTENGGKYHSYGCRYLKKSCIPISLSEAKLRYEPCSVCGG